MKKSTLVALAAFAALTLVYFATRESTVAVGIKKLALEPLALDSIVSIELGGSNPLVFKKDGAAWTVNLQSTPDKRYAADEAQVKLLAEAVAVLKAEDFITDKTDKFDEYEVSEAKGLLLKASTDKGPARQVLIGKASKSGGFYLRLPQSQEVFSAKGNLSSLLKRDINAFRKKSISTVKVDELSRVQIALGASTFTLTGDNGTWKLEEAMPADYRFDNAAAQRLVGQLTNLNAQSFVEGESDETLGFNAGTTFTLTTKEGKAVELKLGNKRQDGTSPVRLAGDDTVYLLPGWQAEAISKTPESLRDMRLLPSMEASAVSQLRIVSGGKKTVVKKDGESWKVLEPKVLPAGFDFAQEQVTAQIQRIGMLRGAKVVRGVSSAQAGLLKPTLEIELDSAGAPTQKIRFGSAVPGETTQIYAQGDDGLVYAAAAHDKSAFEAGLELFKRPPPPPDFRGAQGLEQLPPDIRRQLEAQMRQQQRQ